MHNRTTEDENGECVSDGDRNGNGNGDSNGINTPVTAGHDVSDKEKDSDHERDEPTGDDRLHEPIVGLASSRQHSSDDLRGDGNFGDGDNAAGGKRDEDDFDDSDHRTRGLGKAAAAAQQRESSDSSLPEGRMRDGDFSRTASKVTKIARDDAIETGKGATNIKLVAPRKNGHEACERAKILP